MTDQKVLAQYDKFFTMSLDLLCIAGTDGTFKHVNPAFTRVLGYSPEELISRPFLEFIHPDDRELTQREIAKLATGQLTIHFEHRFLHRDGSVRIFSWSASPDPTTGLLYAAARDVTAQRESELKLNQTDAALNTHAIVAVTDLAGRITEANDKFCEISGYSRAELIGQTHRLLCSGRHSKEFFKDLWKTISSGNSWSGVIENRRKNGESYWVQSVISPLRNAQGAISGYMAIRFDITGQKRAELETQELARKLEQAELLAKIGFWDLDLSNLRGNWSKGQLAVFGLEQADSSPSFEHFMGIVHPDDRAMIKEKFNSILQERRREFEFEFRILLGDGVTVRWLKEYGKLSLGADGSPVRLSGTVQDITEVKVSEIRLKRALKILNETGKMAKVGGWEVDLATGVRTWTDATFSIFEMQPTATGEPNTRDALSSFTPKSKALLESALKRAIEEGQPYSLELESMTTKGNLIWIQTVGQANRVNGKITSISGTIQDITDQKRARQEKNLAFSQLQEAQRIAKIGSWEFDLQNGSLYWSSELYRIFEIQEPRDPYQLYGIQIERIYPEDRANFEKLVAESRRSGADYFYDYRIAMSDGRTKHIHSIGRVTYDEGGRPLKLSGICQDVTDETQRDIETKFLIDSLGLGVWKFEPSTGKLEWDARMYSLFGVNAEDFSGAYAAWESALTPEAKQLAVRELEMALTGEKDFNTTFEIHLKDGQKRHIAGRGIVIRNEKNEPLKMYGVNWDVTSRIQAEALLKQANIKLIQSSKLASLGEMSAGVAHEINNPLAIIGATISLLPQSIGDPEKFQLRLESIKKACARIAKIVNGLRKFSRSSEQSSFRNHALSRIVKESLVLTEAKARLSETIVMTEIQTDSMISCDEVEIEQVLVNLINNAMDAVKSNGLSKQARWVKIQLYDDVESVVLRVIDSGCGIPESVRAKLFDPFFTTKTVGEGTGLGLSITKGILDSHHASIAVVTDMPNTCFELRFKRAESARVAA